MKLGLLDAVPPEFYVADEKSDPDKFRDLFVSVGVRAELPHYDVTLGVYPATLETCDAYLITGSPVSVYDDLPWIGPLEDFIRRCYKAGKPLVGICFGHQLIAQALGGRVEKAEQGWMLGLQRLELLQSEPWMTPQRPDYPLYFINQDQVTELPPGARWLGQAEGCPYAMFTIGEQVLGLQAHPEQPLTSMIAFTEYLKQRLPEQLYRQALASFEADKPQAALVGRWIWQFLQGV